MNQNLSLELGIKADPIQYRYSYEWLFRLLAEEGLSHVQLGTFFEIYQLPDAYFIELKKKADDFGIQLSSIFTAHRELGGFFAGDPAWEAIARKNFERLIQVGGLVGARAVGCNPGAVLRDRMGTKDAGVECYLRNMEELLHIGHEHGLETVTIEPMSCLAEPPTLPEEMADMGEHLAQYHAANKDTVPARYCSDIAHGYANQAGEVLFDHMTLLEASFPHLQEIHLKNTDALFDSTFGFSEEERAKGIVDVPAVRDLLLSKADVIPVDTLVGYLEVGGPKLGRDYSDHLLGDSLRDSLRYLKECFPTETATATTAASIEVSSTPPSKAKDVLIAPSIMCADLCNMEESTRRLENVGVDMLHIDIMDTRFAPNMPLGLEIIKQLRPKTALPFDVHLMVEDNDFFTRLIAPIGVQQISIHVESARHLERSLALIQDSGIKAGAALNPATPLSVLDYVHHRLDFILIMTVNPGYAGQSLIHSALQKIRDCKAYLDQRGLDIPIQVDGNVSFENIAPMVAAGAEILVSGTSSLYHKKGSMTENIDEMKVEITKGLQGRS